MRSRWTRSCPRAQGGGTWFVPGMANDQTGNTNSGSAGWPANVENCVQRKIFLRGISAAASLSSGTRRIRWCPLRRRLLLAFAGTGLHACSFAPIGSTGGASRTAGPHAHGGAEFELDSADGRRRYQVRLVIPTVAAPSAGHPLLVMLDGNVAFGLLDEAMLARLADDGHPLVVATVGYAHGTDDRTARAFDYTPPVPEVWAPPVAVGAAQPEAGGAAQFLDLLQQRVLPEVRRRVAIDVSRSTLWGHSYGGLFGLYTLFTRPASFARYALVDPSVWWHGRYILSLENEAAPLPAGHGTAVLLMTGGRAAAGRHDSSDRAASRPTSGRDVQPVDRRAVLEAEIPGLARRQAQRAGMALDWRQFPDLDHGAVRKASIVPTLEFATATIRAAGADRNCRFRDTWNGRPGSLQV